MRQGASRFQLVTRCVTDMENINGVVADGEDDPMLVFPLSLPAVEEFAEFIGESAALGGDRTARGPRLQRVDRPVKPNQPLFGGDW